MCALFMAPKKPAWHGKKRAPVLARDCDKLSWPCEVGITGSRSSGTFARSPVMPFLAPSFARLPPLSYLLDDQVESRRKIARHLGVSFRDSLQNTFCDHG